MFENRMNVNDDKDGIHQTESIINLNLIDILNEPLDEMHQSVSVTKAPRNCPMSYLAGCTNRHPS